jgi:hypothetical protein
MGGVRSIESGICNICQRRYALQVHTGHLRQHGSKRNPCPGSCTSNFTRLQDVSRPAQITYHVSRRITPEEQEEHAKLVEPCTWDEVGHPFDSYAAWRLWWSRLYLPPPPLGNKK